MLAENWGACVILNDNFSDLNLGVGFQDHMLPVCLVFKGKLSLFSTVVSPATFPPRLHDPPPGPLSVRPLQPISFFVDLLHGKAFQHSV